MIMNPKLLSVKKSIQRVYLLGSPEEAREFISVMETAFNVIHISDDGMTITLEEVIYDNNAKSGDLYEI